MSACQQADDDLINDLRLTFEDRIQPVAKSLYRVEIVGRRCRRGRRGIGPTASHRLSFSYRLSFSHK